MSPKSIAVHCRDAELLGRIERLLPRGIEARVLEHVEDLAEVLLFESPDLVVLGLAPGGDDLVALFERLNADPWTSSVTFLLVSPDNETTIERYGRYRVSYFLEWGDLERSFARVLAILLHGTEALAGAGVVEKLTALSGQLVLETDLFLVQYYAGFFSNYLYKEGYVSPGKKFGVQLALIELLVNAMEHGNANITYDEKTEWLATDRSIQELVEKRMAVAPYRGRKVRFEYRITPAGSLFRITDEGDGFDVSKIPAPGQGPGLLQAHGRGILTSRFSVDRLSYNEKGNSVAIEIDHDGVAEKAVPPGFVDAPPRRFSPGDVVFSEGDAADSLYYVVSGEYDIHVKGTRILSARSSDVFIGEMSFMLGHRRTATVTARTEGQLVQISREAFARAVQQNPSYAIFLCKLLARRLRDAHERYADLAGMVL